jgi:hypothetical protein
MSSQSSSGHPNFLNQQVLLGVLIPNVNFWPPVVEEWRGAVRKHICFRFTPARRWLRNRPRRRAQVASMTSLFLYIEVLSPLGAAQMDCSASRLAKRGVGSIWRVNGLEKSL